MTWMPLLSTALLLVGQAGPSDKAEPPPYTEEQLVRLRRLVTGTQSTATALQNQLADKQRELSRLYGLYELDERQASKLQEEIVELQRQLLANHHKMHAELRTIVGKERFDLLKKRLQLIFDQSGQKKGRPAAPDS